MKDGLRILLIEDNPGDADLIREYLSTSVNIVFQLECQTRMSDALKCLSENTYDLIILDLGLPDCSGISSVEKLKQTDKNVPFIVLTGNNDEQIGIAAVKAGAQDYLIKNELTSRHLISAVRYAMERHALKNERETIIRKLEKALKEVKTL